MERSKIYTPHHIRFNLMFGIQCRLYFFVGEKNTSIWSTVESKTEWKSKFFLFFLLLLFDSLISSFVRSFSFEIRFSGLPYAFLSSRLNDMVADEHIFCVWCLLAPLRRDRDHNHHHHHHQTPSPSFFTVRTKEKI